MAGIQAVAGAAKANMVLDPVTAVIIMGLLLATSTYDRDPDGGVHVHFAFFNALLGGESIARAPRLARLFVKQTGAPAADWAAHMMFGLDSPGA